MKKYRVVFNLSSDDPRYQYAFQLGDKSFATFDAASREAAIGLFLEYVNNLNEWCHVDNLSPITPHSIITVDLLWENKKDGLCYWLCEDGTAEVNGAKVEDKSVFTELIVPDSIVANGKEYKITATGSKAFMDYECLTKIQLSKWLTSIGKEAFLNCAIEEVEIDNLVTFEESAFYCKSLRRIFVKTSMGIENTLKAFGLGAATCHYLPNLENLTIYSSNSEPYTFSVSHFYDVFNDVQGFIEEGSAERHITLISDSPVSLAPENFEELDITPLLKVSFLRKGSNDKMELSFNPSLTSWRTRGILPPLVRFIPQNNDLEDLELDIDQVEDFSDFDIE